MTREEAIQVLTEHKNEYFHTSRIENAIDKAIDALSQPIVAKHFDIQSGYIYCSPEIAENVKVVVRCKDCRYRNQTKVNEKGFEVCTASGMDITDNDFCSYGERKEE